MRTSFIPKSESLQATCVHDLRFSVLCVFMTSEEGKARNRNVSQAPRGEDCSNPPELPNKAVGPVPSPGRGKSVEGSGCGSHAEVQARNGLKTRNTHPYPN